MSYDSTTNLSTETLVKTGIVPAPIRRAFKRSIGHAESMEQMLWREVAARMALDACGLTPEVVTIFDGMDGTAYRRYAKVVTEARIWFERKVKDSSMVFEFAGVDYAPVRKAVLNLPPLRTPQLRMSKSRVVKEANREQQAA